MATSEQAFLSIKEAAQYLNVEYKTIYRLIRLGQLPAGRIGGVYRIRRADLDQFFEQQKSAATSGASAGSAAGSPAAPADLDAGRTAPTLEATPQVLKDETQLLRCSRCLKIIPSPSAAGGRCEFQDCQNLICTDCWQQPDGRLCPLHSLTAQERLVDARQLLADGVIQLLVEGPEARKRELGFLSRFDYKVSQIATIRNPLSGRVVQVHDWAKRRTVADDTARLLELRGVGYLDRGLLSQLPVNQRSLYDVHEAGDKVGLVIEAIAFSHLDAFLRQGFDSAPGSVADLLPLLKTRSDVAEVKNAAYVVGIASTTGWDADAVAYIGTDVSGRSFWHRLLMPCLIDLETSTLICNTLDERLASLAPLFAPQLLDEASEDVARKVRETLLGGKWSSLSAGDVTRDYGVSEDVAVRAFSRLAEGGEFVVEQIKGIGLTISRR